MAEKFVDFHKYCPKCQYKNYLGTMEPCTDCIDEPVNEESHKPVYFKERENSRKKQDV